MFEIRTQGFNEELAKLATLPETLSAALADKINYWLVEIQRKIQAGLEAGEPAKTRTGNLLQSVQVIPAAASATSIEGSVVSEGDAALKGYPYGMVQEFGGTRSYDIYPVTKQALAFEYMGKHVITKHVFHPPLMARPWFYGPAKLMYADIVMDLNRTIQTVLDGKA